VQQADGLEKMETVRLIVEPLLDSGAV